MVFNSLTFACFFAVVLGGYALPLPWWGKKLGLLIASYLFYMAWSPLLVTLLLFSTGLDWFAARGIGAARSRRARALWLTASLAGNLGLLGYFKYTNFLLGSGLTLLGWLGIPTAPRAFDIILPIGISFYTFQTLSYTLDVYLGRAKPWTSLLDFALYVTFFPQLVAGPIVRAADFLPQCATPQRASADQAAWGFTLLVLGVFQKAVLADFLLAPIADQVYLNYLQMSGRDAWLGTLAFSGQIFFDFAGYSTCAIGAAMMLGFRLPDNFRYPYGSIGFSDFWRRWHISLSTWLRDYLYIPLGGNRHGVVRTYVNLLLTMLIGGLWHGAAWRFVVWGGLHGAYLAGERVVVQLLPRGVTLESRWPLRVVGVLATYALVLVTWVFFRAPTFECAWHLIKIMFTGSAKPHSILLFDVYVALLVTGWLLVTHTFMRNRSLESVWSRFPWPLRSALLALMFLAIFFAPSNDRAFIYFQF